MDTVSSTLFPEIGTTSVSVENGTENHLSSGSNTSNNIFPPHEPSEFEAIVDVYVTPVLAILGIFSNALTFVLMLRPPLNGISTSVYLAAHSVSCGMYWTFIVGLQWILNVYGFIGISARSEISCRLWTFVVTAITYSPYWFIIGAAVDRLISVCCPQKAQYMCTVFMGKVGVALTIVFLTATAVHCMWTFYYYTANDVSYCIPRYEGVLSVFYGYAIIIATLSYLSNTLLFILGNLLIIRLCLKHHGRQIPNVSNIDLDMTYIVSALTLIVFAMCTPSTVLNIINTFNLSSKPQYQYLSVQYIAFPGYMISFFILLVRSSDFRDALLAMLKGQILCSRRNSSIELRLMNDYNQVPSTSTSV